MEKVLFVLILGISFHGSVAQDLLSQRNAERCFTSGRELFERNELGAARESFEEFLKISPSQDGRRANAEYYQALCALSLHHIDGERLMVSFCVAHANDPHASIGRYDLGNFFYTDKNYTRAAKEYGNAYFHALTAEQQNSGRFRWGYSLFNQKKLPESLDQFNVVKTQGGQYGPAASYYSGFIEYSVGEYDNALVDLKRADQGPSYAKIVPYLLANVYYKQKNFDGLLNYVSSLKDLDDISNSDEIALLSAEAYFKKSDYKNALAGYQRYFKGKENADQGVLSRAGYAAYSIGQDNAAFDYFKVSASDKDSVGFYSSYYLGLLYLKRQEKPLALTAFNNARKFRSNPPVVEESQYQLAKINFDLSQPDQGIIESERFLVLFPNSLHATEMRELLSQAYTNSNNYNKAIDYIESLPERTPAIEKAFQKATFLKGAELFNKEDYAHAVDFFDKSLKTPSDQNYVAEASVWSGEAYSIGKKYPQAIFQYERILELPGYSNQEVLSRAHYGLGYAFYNSQQYDQALLNFKEFVNQTPKTNTNYVDGIIRLADCDYVTKAYADALGNYRKAIQLNSPDNDYAHLQVGVILGIQRKYAEASSELDQVINNFPKSTHLDEALFQRAQFDFEQGNYPSAIQQFSTLIDSNKPSRFLPYAYQRRAASYYNLKDYNKTAADYISVIEKFPSHPVASGVLLPLQEALNLAHRAGDFDKYLTEFKTVNPNAKGIESIEFEAAKNLYFNQDYEKALTSLRNYISAYPESSHLTEAKYYRAESMYRVKDMENALAAYTEIASDNTFDFANKVTGRIAELEFKQGRYEQAIPHFQKLARTATTKKDQFTAWSGLMESYYQLTQYDSADAYARLILEKGNVNAGAENKATLYLGKTAMARGDYDGAKDEFLSTLNSAQDEYGAEAKYLLAEIFYLTKDYKQCYETLVSLNKDFAAYTDWVGKSYLLMADNFTAMGDRFQTRGTLKSLIENFPLSSVKEEAKARLKKLDDDEAKKKSEAQQDTTDH